MTGIVGSADLRTRQTAVVIDLRERVTSTTGRDRAKAIGASLRTGRQWDRDHQRLQSMVDRALAAWFGVLISARGEFGATPVSGRVCGGNSPTMSSDRSSPGWGS